ncbi:MAG TPA: S8 family serine peptidase [Streptosporangiaceae bacterium]|nr:S8 family serine peptidase [Streptosporangiaceae bacterium]
MLMAVTKLRRCASRSVLVSALALALFAAQFAARPASADAQTLGQLVRADDLVSLRAIDVPTAWARTHGNGVTVAVLDTGADPSVPDLAGSVTVGPDYTRGADPAGYQPPHLHGTYICSIIAGHGSGPGRAEGIIGVAPGARLLSIRVIPDDNEPGFAVYNENSSFADAIANGINYAVGHGASVINMSLGSTGATRNLREALANAIAHSVVIVASAGNGGSAGGGFSPYSYPASFTGVISVAAVGPAGHRASFSEKNSSVVVAAPGINVAGVEGGGTYVSGDGTSPASALVAGVAALIRSAYPHLSPDQVMQAIVTSTSRRPAGGYNPGVGFGEVNAAAALTTAGRLAPQPATGAGSVAATARFGTGRAGPIAVVARDTTRIAAMAAIAFAALLGFVGASLALVASARRRRRRPPLADDLQMWGLDDYTA